MCSYQDKYRRIAYHTLGKKKLTKRDVSDLEKKTGDNKETYHQFTCKPGGRYCRKNYGRG